MTTLKEEEPYAAVVHAKFLSSTCSKCFACNSDELERVKLNRCAGCHVLYYCGKKCQKADWKDHKPECKLLRSTGFVPTTTSRMVMRVIEKSRSQPDFKAYNGRTYDSLKHNSSMTRANTRFFNSAKMIHGEISRFMGPKAPDFDTVFLAMSKNLANGVSIYDGTWYNPRGFGIYLGLSVLDHSCRPDAFIVNQGSKLMLRTANKDLVYSDKLTVSYCEGSEFMNTNQRRDYLLSNCYFFCRCEECEDVESNKKRISGRPACCPESWFSISEHVCNNCNKKVSSELAAKAQNALDRLRDGVAVYTKRIVNATGFLDLVPKWIELFESSKEVLSDENTYLTTFANMIFSNSPPLNIAIKCAEWCLPLARKKPHCIYSVTLFIRREKFYQMAQMPVQVMKQAVNEALACSQVVFGPDHEFTETLLQKKIHYEFHV